MKKFKERCGAALLEVLISIAILGLLTVPISSGIMMSLHINAKSSEIMKARLAVSSAVETIMADGVEPYLSDDKRNSFPDVVIPEGMVLLEDGYWTLTVQSKYFDDISVEMHIRGKDVRTDIPSQSPEGGGE